LTIVVLLILAVIWAAVLIPPLMGARAEGRPADSIGDFRRQLTVLRRAAPASMPPAHTMATMGNVVPIVPVEQLQLRATASRQRTLKRRRDVFYALLSAMAGTLVLGLVPGMRALLGLHLVLDALFVGYVALLLRMRNETAEREMKVRFLPQAGPAPEPLLALRRSAN
jgi:hypothetical protein